MAEGDRQTKHFIAVVHKDKDSAYGVHFPDVPGCHSAADSWNDVHANAVEALRHWFEDAATVEPRGLEDVRELAAADLVAGASLMLVPLIEVSNRKVRANVSMDRGMPRAIDAEAKRRRQTRAAFMTEAARREIEGSH